MREQFMNDHEDASWLREVHCPGAPPFMSFVIEGNEDSPDKVILFGGADPTIFDTPVGVYTLNRKGQLTARRL